jgi:hypothetical protein
MLCGDCCVDIQFSLIFQHFLHRSLTLVVLCPFPGVWRGFAVQFDVNLVRYKTLPHRIRVATFNIDFGSFSICYFCTVDFSFWDMSLMLLLSRPLWLSDSLWFVSTVAAGLQFISSWMYIYILCFCGAWSLFLWLPATPNYALVACRCVVILSFSFSFVLECWTLRRDRISWRFLVRNSGCFSTLGVLVRYLVPIQGFIQTSCWSIHVGYCRNWHELWKLFATACELDFPCCRLLCLRFANCYTALRTKFVLVNRTVFSSSFSREANDDVLCCMFQCCCRHQYVY